MQKKQTILVVASLLVVVLSVTLAYFTAQIIGKEKDISVGSAKLQIIFTDTDGSISGTNIEPGWSTTKKFTIKNNSNATYKYNIVIQNLVNTFITEGYLQYKITSDNNGFSTDGYVDVPKSETATDIVLGSASIEVGVTQTYTIEFIYKNDEDVDQSVDMNKKLSGTIFITEVEESKFTGYEKGSLGYKILEDNPTIGVRTSFDTAFTENTPNTIYKATENNIDIYYFAGVSSIEGHCEYDGQSVFSVGENKLTKSQCLAGNLVCKVDEDIVYSDEGDCENDYGGTLLNYAGEWIEETILINNWVKFGGFYWKVIRTNSDGSIRLLYHGTSATAEDAYIGTSKFNSSDIDPMYNGYMYGTSGSLESNRTNINNSTIKTAIDNWYASNMTSYTKYLSPTAVYCNDREVGSGTYSVTGSKPFYYAAHTRLYTNKTPTYDCTNNSDKFTVDSSTGNGKLRYPIALMTADEIIYAGGLTNKKAPMLWYYINSSLESSTGSKKWWMMSPAIGSDDNVFAVGNSDLLGSLTIEYVYNTVTAIRPVTSLKSCVKYSSGDGTPENPYTILETETGC